MSRPLLRLHSPHRDWLSPGSQLDPKLPPRETSPTQTTRLLLPWRLLGVRVAPELDAPAPLPAWVPEASVKYILHRPWTSLVPFP